MSRRIIAFSLLMAITALAVVRAQTTQPGDAERLAKTAKEFGMTPEELDRFIQRHLGDPIVVDGDLIVGVHRNAAGRVTGVRITTPSRDVRFNRTPDAENLGLRYMRADLTDTPNIAAADDIDGDGRIDRIMLTPAGEKLPHVLLRIGAAFVRAEPIEDGFGIEDGRKLTFDAAQGEWVAAN